MNAPGPTLRFDAGVVRQGRSALGEEMHHFEQHLMSCRGKSLTVLCSKE